MELGKYIIWFINTAGEWELYYHTDDWDDAKDSYKDALITTGCFEDELFLVENKTELVQKKVVVQQSSWHESVTQSLYAFDSSKTDCVGTSWAVSHLLDDIGIKHDCLVGSVYNKEFKKRLDPHVWIVLDDGWIVDLRLRMWFGDNEYVPHGVFHPDNEPDFVFEPEESLLTQSDMQPDMKWSRDMVDVFSDGILSKVQLPYRMGKKSS